METTVALVISNVLFFALCLWLTTQLPRRRLQRGADWAPLMPCPYCGGPMSTTAGCTRCNPALEKALPAIHALVAYYRDDAAATGGAIACPHCHTLMPVPQDESAAAAAATI